MQRKISTNHNSQEGEKGQKEKRRRGREGVTKGRTHTPHEHRCQTVDKMLANKAWYKKDSSSRPTEAYSRNARVISSSKYPYIHIIYCINNIKEKSCVIILMRENNI